MRLALHGGLFSGKSTLAQALVARGFVMVNYTDYLKELYARSLRAVGIDISKAEVVANKEAERPHIISFGTRIGFDKGNYVEEALEEEASSVEHPAGMGDNDGLYPDIVFDNVRFDSQMEKLVKYGFRLVRVNTPESVRLRRALNKRLSPAEFRIRMADASEVPLSPFPGEVYVSVDGDMDTVLNNLTAQLGMAQLMERQQARRGGARAAS